MNIGEAAKKSGLSAKSIRYYEGMGLVLPSFRKDNGYREYDGDKLQELVFLRHARQFGFSLEECKRLLGLLRDPNRRSQEVHELVANRLADIDQRIADLLAMKRVLDEMSGQCPNNEESKCSIIDTLAGKAPRQTLSGGSHE